jgi:LPS export ABC transporter protein LptC
MRLITTRNLLFLAIISITGWLAVQAVRHYRVLEPEASLELIPDNVALTLKNIKYTKTRAGEPLWTLVADSAAHSKDGITRMKNVHIIFFDRENGNIELTADRGELMPEYRKMTVSSNVIVISPQENTLQTDFLEYEEAGNILHTDKMVKINNDHYIVSGKGMRIDVTERTLLLLSEVKARVDGMDSH